MLAIVMVAFGGILPSRAAPTPPPDDLDSTADAVGEKTILPGDALVSNHSFEAGLDGWTQTDGYGDEAGQRCGEALTTTQEWSSDGDASLLLDGARGCPKVGAMSDEVEVEPGQQYTVWADVHDGKVSWAGLQWIGADGEVLESEHTRRNARSDRLELTATAPETATGVRVEIGAIGQTKVDKVLLSGQYTDLGAQVTQRPRFLSSEAGTDENGRDVIWAMATGSEEDPGILMATDVLTGGDHPSGPSAWCHRRLGRQSEPGDRHRLCRDLRGGRVVVVHPGRGRSGQRGCPRHPGMGLRLQRRIRRRRERVRGRVGRTHRRVPRSLGLHIHRG